MPRMAHPSEAPYSTLDPSGVLDALDALGFRGDGRLLQLNSYENRVFQVHLEDAPPVVAKFYRPARWTDAQILEEHQFALELVEAEVPVVPPLPLRPDGPATCLGDPPTLALLPAEQGGFRVAVAESRGGRAPESDDADTLQRLGRFIGRLHAVGARSPFEHRAPLDAKRLGHDAVARVLNSEHLGPAERPGWQAVAREALVMIDAAFDATAAAAIRLHGDCHRGNILWRDEEGPHFVDLDDAAGGPAMQDLWMLLSGDRPARERQLGLLLSGYRRFFDFNRRETALIEPLRSLRMLHHSAWIADRWHDPAFPIAFPWFGSGGYWSQQTIQLREQIEAMAEPALAPDD
jgi:Ser/Thr protein kinase RdoA (MazF antagonist)